MELKLIKSYLTGRKQYIEIKTSKSEVIECSDCKDCSVVQESKLSGLLYCINTNEEPSVHNMLYNNEFTQELLGRDKFTNTDISHTVVNFVDDSNSIIGFKNPTIIQDYLNNYIKIMSIYYNSQKLKINEDKTALMLISQPKYSE